MSKRNRQMNGWLVADKPVGMTSARLCAIVRRLLGVRKLGHAGTLDPLASGVLPLAIGAATKTVPFAMKGHKTYRFVLAFGEERETDDKEGEITAKSEVIPNEEDLVRLLPRFIGDIKQVPPLYSAVKVEGKRACDRKRRGEDVCLPSREVEIYGLRLLKRIASREFLFEAETGKGVYIRSLARDIARACGSVGHVAYLRRVQVGPFSEKNAISLDKLKTKSETELSLNTLLLPVGVVLDDIPALDLRDRNAYRFRCGQRLSVSENGWPQCFSKEGQLVRVEGDSASQNYLALGRIEQGCLRPKRILVETEKGDFDVDNSRATSCID